MKSNIKRYIKNGIFDLRLKFTTLALKSAGDPLRKASLSRERIFSARERALRPEEGPFLPMADSLGQTEDLFRPTEGLVRSVKRPSVRQRVSLPS